jgi:hypothetical protein
MPIGSRGAEPTAVEHRIASTSSVHGNRRPPFWRPHRFVHKLVSLRCRPEPKAKRSPQCTANVGDGSFSTGTRPAIGPGMSVVPPKAEVKSGDRASTSMGRSGLRVSLQTRSLESCATNSPTMSGRPSSRCCRIGRAASRGLTTAESRTASFGSYDPVHRGVICRRASVPAPPATTASVADVELASGAGSWKHLPAVMMQLSK